MARNGIYEVLGEAENPHRDGAGWQKIHKRYRELLVGEGIQLRDEDGRIVRKGLTPEEVEAEEARGFELPRAELLRHRIRYFSDGLALGASEYLEGVFRKNKRKLRIKRKVGPRVPKMAGLGGLQTLRDLRVRI
mgnify:FL=1